MMNDHLFAAAGVIAGNDGRVALRGPALAFVQALDHRFRRLASHWNAVEYAFPSMLPAAALDRLDYFRSFPQLATFPVTLDAEDENLAAFCEGEPVRDAELCLTKMAPLRHVLTPAACYHVYLDQQGAALDAPARFTTIATCFRRETHYLPLRRQWSFSMREIVCLGTAGEVREFLDGAREQAVALLDEIQISVSWQGAADPFFRPASNPQYLMQKLEPVKTEMVFGGELAIGSVNFHHAHFGESFSIRRGSAAANSGCIAFGLERWLAAVIAVHGMDWRSWPLMNGMEALGV